MHLEADKPSAILRRGSRPLEYQRYRDLYKRERKEQGLGGRKKRTLWGTRATMLMLGNIRNLSALFIIYTQTP